MNIAIIGAGIAGLCCAHELERYGFKPTIFERNGYIGEQIAHVGALLQVFDRPIKSVLHYIKDNFNINLKPLNTVNTIITKSPNKTLIANGNLGYFTDRGVGTLDVKRQLYSQLNNTQILFNSVVNFEMLKDKYDYIVVADGTHTPAEQLGCFNILFDGFVHGAVVLGKFDPNTILAWFNKDYCNDGYAYLCPFSNQKAFIGLIVSNTNEREVLHFWEMFKYRENIKYTILEEFSMRHVGGFVYPHSVGNIFLSGNTGGAISTFLGFGQFHSIFLGVMAARAIANGSNYEKLIRPQISKIRQKYQMRRALNSFSNNDLDRLVQILNIPPIKQLIYNSNVDVVKLSAKITKATIPDS